eukprot:TRINITY_DN6085_c0_g1_i3.p1 TRINITY_DN6085_c0_g1~~TRINITY_DN6085_c0_g1_i3.p1  ORF type:complete len:348 (-),score=88.63 TRINITY_DN6085_c0_g1_i3:265-1308(-)
MAGERRALYTHKHAASSFSMQAKVIDDAVPRAMALVILAISCGAIQAYGGSSSLFLGQKSSEGPKTLPVNTKDVHSQVDVDRQVEKFEDKRFQANLAELGSYTSAAAARAAAAAEEATAAEQHVQQLDLTNEVTIASAKDYLNEIQSEAQDAVEASGEVAKTVSEAKTISKAASAKAEKLALKSVEKMFESKYKSLEGWRKEVLTNHWENARQAGIKAFQPYEHMMSVANERANKYKAAAVTLSGVASSLADQASKSSLTAGMKRMNGDMEGAANLDGVARGLRTHSQELKTYAKNLNSESEILSENAPTYLERGLMAAKRARYDANPGYLPPLPMNPDFAYVPPTN